MLPTKSDLNLQCLGKNKCRLSCDKEFWHLLNGRSTDRLVLIWNWWGEDGECRGECRRGLGCCENADRSAVRGSRTVEERMPEAPVQGRFRLEEEPGQP